MSRSFVVVVPVKPPSVGKSRLDALGSAVRAELAAAFALDTVRAVLGAAGVSLVVVACDDPGITAAVTTLGCRVVPDAGGLNETLSAAAVLVRDQLPQAHPVAVCADLPALRSRELSDALALLPADRAAIVADASGTGTTTYAAPYDGFAPAFGPASRARHVAAGALELPGVLAGLRRDVDDPADLEAAVALGVGPHTAAVLARWA